MRLPDRKLLLYMLLLFVVPLSLMVAMQEVDPLRPFDFTEYAEPRNRHYRYCGTGSDGLALAITLATYLVRVTPPHILVCCTQASRYVRSNRVNAPRCAPHCAGDYGPAWMRYGIFGRKCYEVCGCCSMYRRFSQTATCLPVCTHD